MEAAVIFLPSFDTTVRPEATTLSLTFTLTLRVLGFTISTATMAGGAPFGPSTLCLIRPRRVKIFEVIEKTRDLNLRNSGANVTLRANLLLS